MRRYSITYFIGQSFKGLWRNGVMSIASITVLMSCLTVMGAFALLVMNINYNLEELGAFNEIAVFVDMEYNDEQIENLKNTIQSLDNVESVVYVSPQEALAQESDKYGDYSALFDSLDANETYAPSFIIKYADASRVSTLKYQLENTDGIYRVNCRAEFAQNIDKLKNGITIIFMWFLVILFVVSIFVIINTIKLAVFSRRQEISIMRYVGATNWFIILPFVFEGILIGIIAGTVAYLIEWYAYSYMQQMIISDYAMIAMLPFSSVQFMVLLSFIGLGVGTGIVGSCISLNKYLKA